MKLLLSLVCLSLIVYGCSSTTGPADPAGVILPLKVGNMWIFNATEYAADTVRRKLIDTLDVRSDTVIGGETRYLFNSQNGYLNRSDGAYAWGLSQGGEPILQFKYPTRAGDSVYYGDATYSIMIRVVSTSELVTVPAGHFVCHHYFLTASFGQYDVHYFIAPNIGYVKISSIGRLGVQRTSDSAHWLLTKVILQ